MAKMSGYGNWIKQLKYGHTAKVNLIKQFKGEVSEVMAAPLPTVKVYKNQPSVTYATGTYTFHPNEWNYITWTWIKESRVKPVIDRPNMEDWI